VVLEIALPMAVLSLEYRSTWVEVGLKSGPCEEESLTTSPVFQSQATSSLSYLSSVELKVSIKSATLEPLICVLATRGLR